jgi:hypothetical protein
VNGHKARRIRQVTPEWRRYVRGNARRRGLPALTDRQIYRSLKRAYTRGGIH